MRVRGRFVMSRWVNDIMRVAKEGAIERESFRAFFDGN